jgi:hypothetical protein
VAPPRETPGRAVPSGILEEEPGSDELRGLLKVVGFGSVIVAFAAVLFIIFILASAVRIVNEYGSSF